MSNLADNPTITAYDQYAMLYANQQQQHVPVKLYKLALAFFSAKSTIVDIGCGNGQDTAWLYQQGFNAFGIDASKGMLDQARLRYPHLTHIFSQDSLPNLGTLPDQSVDGIFCNNMLMHVPTEQFFRSIQTFKRILRNNGILLLYYDAYTLIPRDNHQRLFSPLHFGELIQLCEICGITLIHQIHERDAVNESAESTTLIFRNTHPDESRGLATIQRILADDNKNTTYKYALIRALCRIARNKDQSITWHSNQVLVPIEDVTIEWIKLYWPLVTTSTFITQGHNDHFKPIVIRSKIQEIRESYHYEETDLPILLNHLDENPEQYKNEIAAITESIIKGPIRHSGGATSNTGFNVFQYDTDKKSMTIPIEIWMDICRFEHWIEDSIVIRWMQLSSSFKHQKSDLNTILQQLLATESDERNTSFLRDLLVNKQVPVKCVWTNQALTSFDVDHVIPYSVWGNNDLWNLLPAKPEINRQKRDHLPTILLLRKQQHIILEYWEYYNYYHPHLFKTQLSRALGRDIFKQNNWQTLAFESFVRKIEWVAAMRGTHRWQPE
jgi:SAM-dependent methyltransferase